MNTTYRVNWASGEVYRLQGDAYIFWKHVHQLTDTELEDVKLNEV